MSDNTSTIESDIIHKKHSHEDGMLSMLDERICMLQVRLDHKESRAVDIILGLIILLSIAFIFIGDGFLKGFGFANDKETYAPIIGIALAFYFGFALAIIYTKRNIRKRQLIEEIESLKSKRNTLRPLKINTNVTYFDRLVDINISNLSDYYIMVKEHTNKSFFASISAGAIGFLLIITGLLIGFSDLNNASSVAYISSGSGVIVEFISGVFFWLYCKTTQQLKGYHDSLVNIQNILLSFKVVEDTNDKETKLEMAKTMITSLNGIKNA